MKSVIIATLIASAAAFAPAQQKSTSTSLAAFEDELGVQVCVAIRFLPIVFLSILLLRQQSFSPRLSVLPFFSIFSS